MTTVINNGQPVGTAVAVLVVTPTPLPSPLPPPAAAATRLTAVLVDGHVEPQLVDDVDGDQPGRPHSLTASCNDDTVHMDDDNSHHQEDQVRRKMPLKS